MSLIIILRQNPSTRLEKKRFLMSSYLETSKGAAGVFKEHAKLCKSKDS
jgi:hypothetical protein